MYLLPDQSESSNHPNHDCVQQMPFYILLRFLKSARSERWTSCDKLTSLDDEDSATFSAYMGVVYSNKPPVSPELSDDEDRKTFTLPVRVYVLADKLQDLQTVNS